MAKKSMIAREKRKVRKATNSRTRRIEMKAKMKKHIDDYDVVHDIQQKLQKMPRSSVMSRVTRRCRQCGRPKAVLRKFGLCRIHLREALMRGDVAGARKSSW